MKTRILAIALLVALGTCLSMGVASQDGGSFDTVSQDLADEKGCLSCHEGIEEIRPEESGMMEAILEKAIPTGDPAGCVVCHGGTPDATTKEAAHAGSNSMLKEKGGPQTFYPDPGSIWIAEQSCGQCHTGYVYRQQRSLMNTEAGKIQGSLHTWGLEEVQDCSVPWGNYDIVDEDGSKPYVGTPAYKRYMKGMVEAYPKQYPSELKQLPGCTAEEASADPRRAGLTYQRQQCQRCHTAVRGSESRGDYRGMGCSSCHILYGNEGYYEGGDPTVDKTEKGHILSHVIRGTREAGGGIPVETCNSCHNRGKRIGVTFQGLMEFPYGTPFGKQGEKQPKLHEKNYLFISDDLHHQMASREGNPTGGLLCQDCHTTVDMHGDGNIFGAGLAQVEIECTDCHGTPEAFPWELPLGFGDEFGRELGEEERGFAKKQLLTSKYATKYEAKEGFLLSARGNPFGNVVKDGDKVILHSATGNDFEVPVLKQINLDDSWVNPTSQVAMEAVAIHTEKMECYACHGSWVPQFYGTQVTVDYSDGKSDVDWIASGMAHDEFGQTAESPLGTQGLTCSGQASESRTYLRWEDPILGFNGEGRMSPLIPAYQFVYSVIGADGSMLAHNQVGTSPDEAAAIGQEHVPLAIDMAPIQPHSAQRVSRTCESCHNNPKAVGLGISSGVFQTRYAEEIIEDLTDARTGEPLVATYQTQIQSIPDLDFDWSVLVRDGVQVATVGTHWPGSRALNGTEIDMIMRTGVCLGCHSMMSDSDLWAKVGTEPRITQEEHTKLMGDMLKAWAEVKPETPK